MQTSCVKLKNSEIIRRISLPEILTESQHPISRQLNIFLRNYRLRVALRNLIQLRTEAIVITVSIVKEG